jgi:hypothetical protein
MRADAFVAAEIEPVMRRLIPELGPDALRFAFEEVPAARLLLDASADALERGHEARRRRIEILVDVAQRAARRRGRTFASALVEVLGGR